jgi:putative MATE family efflux protein
MAIKTELKMTEGNIPKQMLIFALPLMISGWLQLSFNLADYIVCGQFVSQDAVGAIGATGSLTALLIDLFTGFAVGVNVVMGNAYGAKNRDKAEKVIGASALLALLSGLFLAALGISLARTFLTWMATPSSLIDMSSTYMMIYFAGIPFLLLYNFGSAAMRGMGDTTRPFIYLTIGGVINVCLNLLFVIPVKLGVAGLAYATVISEGVSAILVYISLLRNHKGFARFDFRHLRFYRAETTEILRIGVPAGIQNAMFDIANVLIQKNINAFGNNVIAGDSAAGKINNFVYIGMDAFAQAGVAFISANVGAKNTKNIRDSFKWALIFSLAADTVLALLDVLLRRYLLSMIVSNEEAIHNGELNILITISTHSLMTIVDMVAGAERGLGYSVLPAFVSLIGICILRIVYIYTIFQMEQFHTMAYLYATYPISWLITAIAHSVCYAIVSRKKLKKIEEEKSLEAQKA